MTTIKEYKAMIGDVTNAPVGYADISSVKIWSILRGTEYASNEKCYLPFSRVQFETEHVNCDTPIYLHADKLLPELIRVIELAEEALNLADNVLWADVASGAFPQRKFTRDTVDNALSEIRKLKGDA